MKSNFFISVIFIILCVTSLYSQTNSPYTRIGIGDIVYDYSAKRLSMGQTGVSIADNDYINTVNPAGLYNLTLTRFETGIKYSGEFISTESMSKFYAKADFNGFTFGFPISKLYGIGAAIGIVPVSHVNYHLVENQINSSLGKYNASYEGKGGLSRIFASASYRLPFNLNIGASFDYYFGTMDYSTTISFIDQNNSDVNYNLNYSINGLGTTLGLISPDLSGFIKSETITDFRVGAALSLISDLSVDTMVVGTSNFAIDTTHSGSAKMKLPYRLTVGASLKLNSNYLISFDYSYQPWEEYSFNSKSNNLRNSSRLGLGFEYKPIRSYDKSFWEQITYRAGLIFEQTQYEINGHGIDKFGITGGFSLPISDVNSITVGLELAMRGTKDFGLYKENIYRLNVGLNLGELWFIRPER